MAVAGLGRDAESIVLAVGPDVAEGRDGEPTLATDLGGRQQNS
jgi:hypothetical protein